MERNQLTNDLNDLNDAETEAAFDRILRETSGHDLAQLPEGKSFFLYFYFVHNPIK